MSFENLYKYEDMAYGAYHLASTPAVREEALQLLVTEYNHPQSARFEPGARPHDHIDQIMCRLVEDDLKGQAESLRIRGMLNPFRYARDVDYYEKMRKFRK